MSGALTELKAHYELIAKLLAGQSLDRDTIASHLGVMQAAADRHMRALIEAIPQLVHERVGRLRTLRLPPEHVQRVPTRTMAVAACCGAALARLFRNSGYERGLREALDQVLQHVKGRNEFRDSDRKFIFVAQGGESALPENENELDKIVDGILRCVSLRLEYLHFNGRATKRKIEPLSLAIYQHQLYLLARERGKTTVLRFSRIRGTTVTKQRFTYPTRLEYDPVVVFRNALGIFVKDEPSLPVTDVVFRLGDRWRTYAQFHRWHESQQTEVRRGHVQVRMHVAVCPEVEQLVLGFGEDCEVVAPPELRERIAERVRKMSRM